VKRGLLGLLIAALVALPPLGEPYVLHVAITVLPSGSVVMATCRPHASSLFAPSRVNVVARREPTPVMK